MTSWRDTILCEFVPQVSKLTLVADPDGLLTEEKLAVALRKRGFDLIEYNDAVEFRYAYESKYRSIWDRGEHTNLVVVLRVQDAELENLPYDLLKVGRSLAFDLGGLFPNLSYPVVEELDRSLLDTLFDAQNTSAPDRMGDNATKDFILRHVFGIAAELIVNDVELLRALLRIHYNRTSIPPTLSDRLVQVLRNQKRFHNWPLDEIVPDEKVFYEFLQERWPIFLGGLNSQDQVREDTPVRSLEYPGPDTLPFDHQDIRVYIDNLFVEGKLTPVEHRGFSVDAGAWIKSGLIDADDNVEVRISRLFKLIERDLPVLDSRHTDWTVFALKWAELAALIHDGFPSEYSDRYAAISKSLNETFRQWLLTHYGSLINLPPTTPAMLHHVTRHLARIMEDSQSSRIALVVVDGLAMDQWVSMRRILQEQDRSLAVRESAVFAWIPTLTSVSRQAIFAGKPPLYFPSSINSTNSEVNLWKQFWEGIGLSRLDIAYQRGLGDGDVVSVLDASLHPTRTKIVGLVVDKIDKIMHGMQLGAAGMHNQIKQWCSKGFLSSLVDYLLDHGYQVWLTSDHGNVECNGRGRPTEGAIAETRGERVRVYPSPDLRASVAEEFSFAHEWQPFGLPPGYYPLVAGGSDGFVNPGETIVGHGGIALEEVIVPLVKLERKTH